MRTTTSDLPLRLATFEWLEEQSAIHGEVLPWPVLLAGFVHEGVRVPLVSMQGIFTPRAGRLPLTIRTAVGGPYADASDNYLHDRPHTSLGGLAVTPPEEQIPKPFSR